MRQRRRSRTDRSRTPLRVLGLTASLALLGALAAPPAGAVTPALGSAWGSIHLGSAWGDVQGAAQDVARVAPLDRGLSTTGSAPTKVVVSGRAGSDSSVRAALLRAGATHLRPIAIIHGWAASVPASALRALATAPGVTAVTKDRAVQLTGSGWDTSVSASPFAWTSQAVGAWRGSGLTPGVDGSGVSIAVLDTGVSSIHDLSGRLLQGPDLSGENDHTVDSFGHGTVMAGIAAGDGTAAGSQPRTGVAPGAKVIAVKVAGANGATDVSTLLAGLTWVAAFKDVYGIRVLNLSWGVPSTQDPTIDPLNFAVETLWHLGVTVVVAAGNSGPHAGTILKPGDDPLAITVGAFDDHGDSVRTNDSVPAWSSQGPTAQGRAKPDLVAPGRTLIAPRAPGSHVEQVNPTALVSGGYIRASGTSEATAVTSGVVALLLDAHPSWTPDQVKRALKSSASPIPGVSATLQGAGRVQAQAAIAASPGLPLQQLVVALGTGSLQASRGSMVPVQVTCSGQPVVLVGELTSWCSPWLSSAWTSSAWTSSAWTSSAWTSSAWTSSAWTSSAWTSSAWTSSAWTSSAWTSSAWTSYDDPSAGGESDASPDTPDLFLSAFFGSHPKFGRHLPGEVSLDPPGHGRTLTNR